MSKTKAILGVCLIFLMGMISGGAVTMKVMEHRFHHFMEEGPGGMGQMIVHRLTHDLKLDAPQHEKLKQIVESSQKEIQAVRDQLDPQIKRVMESSSTQIRAILTPEQATKFDEIAAKARQRWPGPHHMPPPPPMP
jgi:Spy/CpxP family protein refolding chaperone